MPQLQELVDNAKLTQLGLHSVDDLLDYGDIILIKIPILESYFQLLLVANSQKSAEYVTTHNVDCVEGIDSREIILKVFNYCNQLGDDAESVFLGAMGTNGLSFPYEVITAEIMNCYLYSVKLGKPPVNLFFSVRSEDMVKTGVTSQAIYNYVGNVISFF